MNYKYNIALILLLNLSLNFSVYAMEEQGKENEFDKANKHLAMHPEVAQVGDGSYEEQDKASSAVEITKLHLLDLPTELILSINNFLKPNPEASCEQILEQLENILMFSESAKSLQAELEAELIKHIRTNLDHYGAITNYNKDNLFVAAVKDGKYKLASLLLSLSEQFNIEILNLAEIKLFFAWAVSNGHSQIATICLSFIEEKTTVVNILDKINKQTLLHQAAMNGNEDCVTILLDNGADVNPLDSNDNIPLDWACRYGHLNVVKLLVYNHANTNAQNKRPYYIATPLKYAVLYGKKNVVEFLLNIGIKVNSKYVDDFSPLECALLASNGTTSHDEIIAVLLLHGVPDTDLKSIVDKERAVFFATEFNFCETARLLLAEEAKSHLGRTPLINAVVYNNGDMVKILIANGAKINAKSYQGTTALIAAIFEHDYELCKLLSSYKELINEPNNDLASPLHCALLSKNADLKIIKLLVDAGADVNYLHGDISPLVEVISNLAFNSRSKYKVIKSLIDKGANVNFIQKNGNSILINAICASGIDLEIRYKIIELLIQKNADINFMNQYKDSALLNAVLCNKPEIVRLLIRHRTDIYHQDMNKMTALDIAKQLKREEIIQLLIDAKKRGNRRK